MVKKGLYSAAVVAALLISGCSQKEPEVDMTASKKEQVAQDAYAPIRADKSLDTVQGGMESSDIVSADSRLQKAKAIEEKTEPIYFDFDKFAIRSDQAPRLENDAQLFLSDDAKDLTIKIEGNCDEWGTDEYNYALGLKRAKAVQDALLLKGIDASRMVMVSYGESNPICTEHTKECWAKNRRVDFKLLP